VNVLHERTQLYITHHKSGTIFIDHAKGAFIVRATDGRLDQEGVRLAGRPVNGSFVAHTKIDGNLRFFPVIKEKFCTTK